MMLVWLSKKSIEYYWKNVPESNRGICIYRISCSRYVYNKFCEEGFIGGLSSFIRRVRSCNGGYTIRKENNKIFIEDRNGFLINENDINPLIIKEFKSL